MEYIPEEVERLVEEEAEKEIDIDSEDYKEIIIEDKWGNGMQEYDEEIEVVEPIEYDDIQTE